MDAFRWTALVVAIAALGAVLVLIIRRGPPAARADEPPPAPAPAPAPQRPPVLPGDHEKTPLFPAIEGQRWGYIDASGTFVIAPQYSGAEPFSEGLAFVTLAADGRLVCIDKNAREQFTLTNPSPTGWLVPEGGFREGFALVILQASGGGNRYSYVDRKGAMLGPPRFWPAHPFSDGVAAVAENGRWGFLGPDGKPVIPLAQREVFDFTEGLAAAVLRKGRMGYIDHHGKEVIPARYELAMEFGDGLAPVQPGSSSTGPTTMGYIDRTGKMIIPPRFAHAHPFSEGRARVLLDVGSPERWAYIDTTGKVIMEPRYLEATEFHDGMAAVRTGASWGYVDRDGREVIAPAYEMAGSFESGLARVRRRGSGSGSVPRFELREGYIDRAGKWIYSWEVHEFR